LLLHVQGSLAPGSTQWYKQQEFVAAMFTAGHKHLLRTLVDAHIAQQGPQRLLCAGGGSKDMQLLLSVQQLLSVTAGEVAAFSTTQQPGRLRQAIAQQQPAELQQQLQQLGPAAFAHFPAPWPAGAEEVELFGVVAQRRR
jgi:hypothetical protein